MEYVARITVKRGDIDVRVRLMVTKTNHFNTEFVLKTPPTVVYISFHVYLTRDTTSNVMSVHYLVNSY